MLELASGTALGSYVITARIGRGGMASVYQAHHPALDRNVAIKVLWESLADQPGFLERFRREARAASRLRHPNILTVYDFGEEDGIAYMVTELLPGGTLADRLSGPLQFTEVLRVLRGIGSALDAAHDAGLIHRDVKPSNILFTRDGEPVLADFGIARIAEAEEHLTVKGTLIGTPHYMAPEMAAGEEVGRASDLYSLGVVLYEMLAGEPPFPRPTPIAVVRAHIHESPPPLAERHPPLPAEIDAVVARALAKRPDQRYRSGAALAAAFEDAMLDGDPPTPRPGAIATWNGLPVDTPPAEGVTAEMAPWAEPATREARAQTSFDPYEAVIPGPPGAYGPAPNAYTDRWPQATPVRRERGAGFWPLVIVALIAVLVTAGAFFARSTDLLSQLGLTDDPAATQTPRAGPIVTVTTVPTTAPGNVTTPGPVTPPALGIASPSPEAGASPAASPGAGASPIAATSPTAVTAPPPSSGQAATTPPTTTPPSSGQAEPPTPTPDSRRGPLAAQFVSPVNGSAVPARPPIVGRRTGLQAPDEHLWMLIQPEGSTENNWWPYKQELIADRDGGWRIEDVEIGGPPGSKHVLVIGVADASTHQAILTQIKERQDEPFVGGQPPGFRELSRVVVTKR
jgi:eukaryotic-like serine/threonine-protein kinase